MADDASADGDPATRWETQCYSSQFMVGKPGVGLVVGLAQPAAGTLTFDLDLAPSQIEVFATAGAEIPAQLDAWGAPIAPKSLKEQPGPIEASTPTPVRNLLIVFRELPPDTGCSDAYPYRGAISEVTFTPS